MITVKTLYCHSLHSADFNFSEIAYLSHTLHYPRSIFHCFYYFWHLFYMTDSIHFLSQSIEIN